MVEIQKKLKFLDLGPKDQKLIINLSHCKYDVLKEVASEDFGMIVWNDSGEDRNWDIFWSDCVRPFFRFFSDFEFLVIFLGVGCAF